MIGRKTHRVGVCDSTNRLALELARNGADEGEVVVAGQQTAGRGRLSRVWESPEGKNIYMSVILKPKKSEGVSQLTLVAGVAVAEMLKYYTGGRIGIKWPNDVWLNGKKVCGILTEAESGKNGTTVILGIGINVNANLSDFSPAIQKIATSLSIVNNQICDLERVFSSTCNELEQWYQKWLQEGFAPIRERYGFWSAIDGRIVEVSFNNEKMRGIARGIADDGALLLETDEGEEERVIAGDVCLCS